MQKPYFIQPGSEPIKPSEKITRYEVLELKGEASEDEYNDNELTLQNILDAIGDRDPAKVKIIARTYLDRCSETLVVIDVHYFYEIDNPYYEKEMERYLKEKADWDLEVGARKEFIKTSNALILKHEKNRKKVLEKEKLEEAAKLLKASGYKIHKK